MPTYSNGEVPYDVVSVVLATGTDSNGYWEFRCTPAFAARWKLAKAYAEERFGRTIYIRPGWNIYRPLFSQEIARRNACAQGNCNGAAVPRSSSHGGNWNGRDCLAVDVDPNGLTWAQVDEAMIYAGFAAGLITERISGIKGGEPWHYILFGDNAFGAVPAGLDATPFEEDDMQLSDRLSVPGGTITVAEGLSAAFVVKQALFDGGSSMQDGGRSVSFSLANLTVFADQTWRGVSELLGRPVADVDEDQLATLLGPLLSALPDDQIEKLAQRVADVADERARKRLEQ